MDQADVADLLPLADVEDEDELDDEDEPLAVGEVAADDDELDESALEDFSDLVELDASDAVVPARESVR